MEASSSWSTRANAVTGLRLLCAPALATALFAGAAELAAVVFGLAVATDLADGWIARRFGESSHFGGALDHAADAVFVTTGTAALAGLGLLPTVLPILIGLAFLQYVLDSRLLEEASARLRPSVLGRWNGIAYFFAVGIPVLRDALGVGWPAAELVRGIGWLLVASTLLSMGDRFLLLQRARRAAGFPIPRSR